MADLAPLADATARTLSQDPAERRSAESFLSQKASEPRFSVSLLQLIALESCPQHVRQAAAVYLKNHTISVYSNSNWDSTPADDRNAVKDSIVSIMLAVPVVVRRQLSEVLAIIAEHEYPAAWPGLVPQLGANLTAILRAAEAAQGDATQAVDWVALEGILETLYVIFERYPERTRSNELYTEINYSLKHTQAQVQALFVLLNEIVADNVDKKDRALAGAVFVNIELLCKVFYCLSWQQLPAYVEDNMAVFMAELRKLLVYESAIIDEEDYETPSCVDRMHAAVLEITNHFVVHYDEEFRPYLQQFLSDTWALLVRKSNAPKYDSIVTNGIKFLTAVSRSPDYALFKDPSVLHQICTSIVIPNIELRDEDEELFEDNPVEYVRKDLEGSDTETRRRGSVELVKGLCVHHEQAVTGIFSAYVQQVLKPNAHWRRRDTIIYVITALGWKKGTLAGGATETSTIINVVDFFNNFVMPELSSFAERPAELNMPIFVADLIKYVMSFRNQIPKEDCAKVFMLCVKLLTAREPVVRTYAAACMERILTIRDNVPHATQNGTPNGARSSGTVPRMSKEDLQPVLPSLLSAVVPALEDSSRSNEYVMRLVLRFCSVARETMGPYVEKLLSSLVQILVAVTANPANPIFNHYLFEAISALIRFNGSAQSVTVFETALVSPLCKILIDDVTEFAPYVFQVLSQLMAVHSGPLPVTYSNLMGPILTPTMWDKRGYIPGMVQFIDVYIRTNSAAVVSSNHMEPILGVFQKLLASKATDHHALQLLNAIFETYNAATISPYVQRIFQILLLRVTSAKTTKLCSNLVCTLSIFILRYGVSAMKNAFDQLQTNMFASFLREVWVTQVMIIRNQEMRQLCAIALSELACGPDDLCVNPPYLELWPQLISANVALLEGIVLDKDKGEELRDTEEEESQHLGAGESYSASHSRLKWATPEPTVAVIIGQRNARSVLATRISEFTQRHAGKYESIMQEKVEPHARDAIRKYMSAVQTA